jgi:hypothetical protein
MNKDLLEQLAELEKQYRQYEALRTSLEKQFKAFGRDALPQMQANGWSMPSHYAAPWQSLKYGDLQYANIELTRKYLSETPAVDWKTALNINFPIVEIRRLVFDGSFLDRELFARQGRYGYKGFYSSWRDNQAEHSSNYHFLKKSAKSGKAFILLAEALDFDKTYENPGQTYSEKYGTILINNNRNAFRGKLVGFPPKTDKAIVYNGDHINEVAIPNQKQAMIEAIKTEMQITHEQIKKDAASELTHPNAFIRYYAQQVTKGLI